MEKRIVNIDDKKEVKPQKKRKRKPVVKKQVYKKPEKRQWISGEPIWVNADDRFNSMNDIM